MTNVVGSPMFVLCAPTPSPAQLGWLDGPQSITFHNSLITGHLSSNTETYPERWALVETDGEGGMEGLGQMDGRLAGAANTELGPLGGGLSYAGSREGWVPRAKSPSTDLATHKIMA